MSKSLLPVTWQTTIPQSLVLSADGVDLWCCRRSAVQDTNFFLRSSLARYLNRDPESLRFSYHTSGKPELLGQDLPSLYFNLSHSGDFLLLAVTALGAVGVDLEWVDPRRKILAVAQRFFSAEELDFVEMAMPAQRRIRAYEIWCQKEAKAKASGEGLKFIFRRCPSSDYQAWSLPVPLPHYVAALALKKTPQEIRGFF